MSVNNFSGIDKLHKNFRHLGTDGQPVGKEAGEPAPRPDGRGESELHVQVEHTDGDPKTTDLAAIIAGIAREQIAKNPSLDKIALGKAIIEALAAKGYAVAQKAAAELAGDSNTVLKSYGTSLNVFCRIVRKDEAKRLVYGVIAQEQPDKAGEVFDYASSKPHFQKWSSDAAERTTSAGQPVSYGNVRAQHSNIAAGKLIDIAFDDERKCIPVVAKIVDDNEWKKVMEGVYSGFSIGGKYLRKWPDGANTRYTAQPAEVSLVDSPAMPSATFTAVKNAPGDSLARLQVDVAQQLNDLVKLIQDVLVKPRVKATAPAGPKRFAAQGHADPNVVTKAAVELEKSLANGKRVDELTQPGDVKKSSSFQPATQTTTVGVSVRSDGRRVFNGKVEAAD